MKKHYAKTSWQISDIHELKPDWSLERCSQFLRNNQRHIQEAMIERGYAAIETLMTMEEE